jgi:Flp pilus assembly protein TadG
MDECRIHGFVLAERPEQQVCAWAESRPGLVRRTEYVNHGNAFVNGRKSLPSRGSLGQSLVELALVLPIILLLFMAIFDFGRAIFAFNTVSNAARDGARTAIVDQRSTAGVSNAAKAAADQAVGLGLDPTDVTEVQVRYLLPDLSAACPSIWGEWVGCIAEVRVQYRYDAATPIIGGLVGPITVGSTTQLPVEKTNK